MARPLRVEYPGAFYHVMNRGNAGDDIFISERDREKFQEYLSLAKERFSLIIHTYCLMTNHYHLLIETPEANLGRAIHWLNVSYATYFNKKRQRKGHLFQGRYKAILVDADEYLTCLSRYIHLNPIRAKMTETADSYRWSSYAAFIGKASPPDWLETGYLLSNFSKQKKKAIQNYKAFVEEVESKSVENPEKALVGGFILGDNDFVNWVTETFLSDRDETREIPQLKQLTRQCTPEKIVEEVCNVYGCVKEAILVKGKKKNQFRDIAIYLVRELCGLSCKEAGNYFGGISGAAVTIRCNYLMKEMKKDTALYKEVKRVKNSILNN